MLFIRYASIVALIGLLTIPAVAGERANPLMQIIRKIKAEPSKQKRSDLSVQLVNIVIMRKEEGLSDLELSKLASLLESSDDGVRLYAASALGVLGPSAQIAVPALRKAEEEVKCRSVEFSSQATILFALEKITGVPQELPTCDR